MKKYLLAVPVFAVLLSACSSMVQKSGEMLEGKNFAGKPEVIYRSERKKRNARFEITEKRLKNGESFLEIRDSTIPGLVLRGNLPGADGTFDLVEADFLSTHVSGWNEFTLELIASARLRETVGGAVLELTSSVESVQISAGRIRLKGSRIAGADALRNLRNRRERILAVISWMEEKYEAQVFESQREFENFWKPVLFPETVSKAKRPEGYNEESTNRVRADSILWNADYTEMLFPEWLRELRNSGALLRDWEEALPWFYLEFQWDSIISAFDGIALQKL